MSHDVHMPHVPHTPHDDCHNGQVHDDQPSTTALHIAVQLDVSLVEEQENTQADAEAIGAAAESLIEGVRTRCHSSISPDSR